MSGENVSGALFDDQPRMIISPTTEPTSGVLTLARHALLAYPIIVVLVAGLMIGFGLFAFAHFPKSYTANTIITPPAELDRLNVQSGLSSGSLGGLSSLASLGGAQSAGQTRYETFSTLLTSRRIADIMIRDHDALRQLYPKLWDPQKNTWKRPTGHLSRLMNRFKTAMGYPGWAPPDAVTLAKFMKGHLTVNQSLKNSQRTLSLTAKNPALAQNLLTWAMDASDAAVRADAIDRAKAQLSYVNDQLSGQITDTEDRTVLTEILMGTQRSMVLASTGSTFAEQVVQAPETSDIPTSPPFALGILVVFVVSVAGGVGAAMLRDRYAPRR